MRAGGRFVEVTWEEALEAIATRLLAIRAESGPRLDPPLPLGRSLGLLKSVVDYFWELLGPVTVKRGDICSGGGDAAQMTDFGDEESNDILRRARVEEHPALGKKPERLETSTCCRSSRRRRRPARG